MSIRLRHVPPRLATGLFILNSGLSKRHADAETAARLHGSAAGAYPFLANVDPEVFARYLSKAEITLGAALLLPIVPTSVAALGLTGFSGGLVGMYLCTPALRQEGSLRPSPDGVAIAKDSWMLGIALGMLIDVLTPRRRR